MDELETLSRAWIECDPNRQGNSVGSGFHPDDPITSGSADMIGQPRWWFLPRAEALKAYLSDHGYRLVSDGNEA